MILNRDFIAVTCINSGIDHLKIDIERILAKYDISELSLIDFKLPEQPYNSPNKAVTIWEPSVKKNSTMLMANFSDGWFTLVQILGTKYQHELYRLRLSKPESKWPVYSMTYFKNGSEVRVIQSLKDEPRWQFFERGEVLSFENPEYYKKRRIKDRFNKEILLEYLSEAGWDLHNNKMWNPINIGYLITMR